MSPGLVNLADRSVGAGVYVAMLRDYEYLQPDLICIYDGYDMLPGDIPPRGRRESLVFRMVGYLPIRSAALVRPADPAIAVAPVLQDTPAQVGDPSCAGLSASYCAAMAQAVSFALDRGIPVVVATPPYISSRHEIQQRSLATALTAQFGRDSRFRYVNLGRAIDLRDSAYSLDGIDPTLAGNVAVAGQLAREMLELVLARAGRRVN